MQSDNVKIKIFSVQELKDWVDKGIKNGITTDVISVSRANAIINNPYVTDSMPALAIAIFDNKIVGYTAVFPDQINSSLFFWGTTGFIDASVRGKGIGTRLYSAMMLATGNRWLASDSSASALAVSKKNGLSIAYYNRYYLNFNYSKNNLKSLLLKIRLQIKNNRIVKDISDSISLNVTKHIDAKTYDFMSQNTSNGTYIRERKMLNWIMSFPFKIEAPSDLNKYSNYEFTTAIEQYSIYGLQIVCDGVLIGFAMFRLSMCKLSLLYLFYSKENQTIVFDAIIKHILLQNITIFTTFEVGLINRFNSIGCKSMNSKSRILKVSLSYPESFPIDLFPNLQGGDGDMFC